ncbi:MAG TPA: ATP-dependent zinc metalloprotease FtsH [Chloroflexota bacterium]|nr:ATP-dependent zinc metalloprotease FtsH [Chloroflexota bacterium]
MRPNVRHLVWTVAPLVLVVAALAMLLVRPAERRDPRRVSVSEIAQRVRDGDVTELVVSDRGGRATTRSGEQLSFFVGDTSPLKLMTGLGVSRDELARVTYRVDEPQPGWLGLVPLVLVAAVMVFAWHRLREGGQASNSVLSFGRSRARVVQPVGSGITFDDVAGVDEPRQELEEIVEFLKEPHKFAEVGARIPRGLLLVGPPGTGKTLLARAVAGEANVPFFSISGSEFVEMFVGVGAGRVRDLFVDARKKAPCIVFVDEIDAVGRQRGAGLGNANDEREQTLNQILVEMDGFDDHAGVVVIAATNRPDVLDPALLRPGRFDRVVLVPAPDLSGRKAILDVHARGKPLDSGVALDVLARETIGFSGADLANVLNEGAILAARRDKQSIGMPELEEAIDRVIVGPERPSHVMSRHEKELTAYHESGRAVVARLLIHHDPVHRISITPRGLRTGSTRFLPAEDRVYMTRSQFDDAVAATLGGHAAEAVVFGELSTSSTDDIERATTLVRRQVKEWGMSERLGPITFGRRQQMIFLGRDIGEQRDYSQRTGELIDEEIRRLIDEGYARAKRIVGEHRDVLDRLAAELLDHESLDAQAVERIFSAPKSSAESGSLRT